MFEKQKGRVIITSSRHIMALVIARSLGEKGIEIISSDCIRPTMVSLSKYAHNHETYTNYLYDEEAFLDDLERIIRKYQPENQRPYLLIPVFKETLTISRHAERFSSLITIACPSYHSVKRIYPKDQFIRTAQTHRIHIPWSYLPEVEHDLKEINSQSSFPILVKPYNESGGRGIQKVQNPEELNTAFHKITSEYGTPPLIQELVQGEDYCFTALFDRGILKASMAYKNLLEFPPEGGSGVIRETIDDAPFIDEVKKLFQHLSWSGVAQIDFKWNGTKSQTPYMIEVNPRFWAGLFQSVQSGIDYPWLLYLLFTHQHLKVPAKPVLGTKTKIPLIWLIPMVQESIHVGKHLHELKNATSEVFKDSLKKGNLKKSLELLFNKLTRDKEPIIEGKNMISTLQEARNAENEIFSSEDPMASLGIIYSLVYFAKYFELPPEVG